MAGKSKKNSSSGLIYKCTHCKLEQEIRYAELVAHQKGCEKILKAKMAAEKVKAEAAEKMKAEAAAANSKKNRSKKNRKNRSKN